MENLSSRGVEYQIVSLRRRGGMATETIMIPKIPNTKTTADDDDNIISDG